MLATVLHRNDDGSPDIYALRAHLRRQHMAERRAELARQVAASLTARREGRRVYGDMFIRHALDSAIRDQLTALAPTVDASLRREPRDIEATTAVARPPRAA